MKHITESIRDGLITSSDQKVIATAKQFMSDNGFKTSVQGKLVACSEVAQFYADEPELSTAVQAAIVAL